MAVATTTKTPGDKQVSPHILLQRVFEKIMRHLATFEKIADTPLYKSDEKEATPQEVADKSSKKIEKEKGTTSGKIVEVPLKKRDGKEITPRKVAPRPFENEERKWPPTLKEVEDRIAKKFAERALTPPKFADKPLPKPTFTMAVGLTTERPEGKNRTLQTVPDESVKIVEEKNITASKSANTPLEKSDRMETLQELCARIDKGIEARKHPPPEPTPRSLKKLLTILDVNREDPTTDYIDFTHIEWDCISAFRTREKKQWKYYEAMHKKGTDALHAFFDRERELKAEYEKRKTEKKRLREERAKKEYQEILDKLAPLDEYLKLQEEMDDDEFGKTLNPEEKRLLILEMTKQQKASIDAWNSSVDQWEKIELKSKSSWNNSIGKFEKIEEYDWLDVFEAHHLYHDDEITAMVNAKDGEPKEEDEGQENDEWIKDYEETHFYR
ncbi:hypothetical protein B0J14DRAFT_683679 [Halenospora varia]|nr:hypothetical protein B0J14DRAFT_683679 [Halenospora varia]